MNRTVRAISTAAIMVFLVFSVLSSETDGLSVTFKGKSVTLATRHLFGEQLVDLAELNRILGGDLILVEEDLGVWWNFEGERIEFTHGSPFYKAGRRVYGLPSPAWFDVGVFLVPVRFVTLDLEQLFPDIFAYDGESRTLRDIRDFAHLKSFRVEVGGNSTEIELLTTSSVRFALDNTKPGSFLINLYRTRISTAIEDSIMKSGYVDSVRVITYSDGSQLMFYLDSKAERYRVAETTQPVGLKITFTGLSLEEKGAPVAQKPASHERMAKDFRIRSVMIDPGHGGKDPGAVSQGTVMEKDINLKVSKMLSKMFESEGFEVSMTRDRDEFVPLSTRTELANSNGADLFVSIHCNSSSNKSLKGFEVYFLSEAKTDDERAVAHRENMSLKYERPDLDPTTLGDIQFIFWDLAQNEFLAESYECARAISKEISTGLQVDRSQVKQAGFYVLNGVYMPSVLVELAYLSNADERKLLSQNSYLEKITKQLYKGLRIYIDTYNSRVKG